MILSLVANASIVLMAARRAVGQCPEHSARTQKPVNLEYLLVRPFMSVMIVVSVAQIAPTE